MSEEVVNFRVLNQQEYDSWVRDLRQIMHTYVAAEIQDDPLVSDKDAYYDDPGVVLNKGTGRKHFIHTFQKEAMDYLVKLIEMYLCYCTGHAYYATPAASEINRLFKHLSATMPDKCRRYFGYHLDIQKKAGSTGTIGNLIQTNNDTKGTTMAEGLLDFIAYVARSATRYAITHDVHTINLATMRSIVQSVSSFCYEPDLMWVL